MDIAIIGGTGKMGRWFARFLAAEGREIVLIGRDEARLKPAAAELGVDYSADMADAAKADVVIISVPVDAFEEVAKQLGQYTRQDQIILDITSIKALPVEAMQRYIKNGWLLGTHPVFGPGARNITNHNFALTPTNQAESALAERVKAYLEARKARVHLMTPGEHDDMMAVILGLAHYIAIVSADSLSGFKHLKEMEAIGGITYKVLLTLVESVISEDAGLYASLQVSLPNLPQIQQDFQRRCREWSELVASKDKAEFSRRMTEIRRKLEAGNPDFGKAYDNMYKIADNL
jgi:prephenate dehydrogenase